MKPRILLVVLALVLASVTAWLAARAYFRTTPSTDANVEAGSPTPVPPRDPEELWPAQPSPRWPSQCLIENVAVHPTQPWLTVACTNSAAQSGAVLVFDAESGQLRSATELSDELVGWSEQENLLRWHPEGQRLTTNVATNGIALLDRGRIVGSAHPDETRDSGVRHVWVGDRLFSDTGALFEIRAGDPAFDFESITSLPFQEIEWNATIGAVVGRAGRGIAAFDPIGRRVLYHEAMEDLPESYSMRWSPDGRWCARRNHGEFDAGDEILIFNGDDGRRQWRIAPSPPRIHSMSWTRDGSLLLLRQTYDRGTGQTAISRVDVARNGRIDATIDLGARAIQASHDIPEVDGAAWSPGGDGLALLLDRQEIQLRDARSGAVLSTFAAPAPAIPAGLPEHYRNAVRPPFGSPGDLMWIAPQRLVRLAPHFVEFWSIDGQTLARHVVPDP